MYFTLAVSAATAEECASLTDRARVTDPAVLPLPGAPAVAWRAPDGRAAILRWGAGGESGVAPAGASHAGTIWPGQPASGGGPAPVHARTSVTRVDPVYVARQRGAVILSDRATWAASVAGRLGDHDPLLLCALLNPGFPLGSATPFRGVSAVSPATTLHVLAGKLTRTRTPVDPAAPAGAGEVAAALIAAVRPLREAGTPVQLSLTGGKDSRLMVAALAAAGVEVRARTHGFAGHPDVVVAAEIARRLGIEHDVREPAAPGQQIDVLARIRATVLVADGMLSAFENVGRPDPAPSAVVTAGGHGGELLRGGYAEAVAGRPGAGGRAALRAAELLRRLTTGNLGLLRRGAAAGYLASLAPWTAALARGPLPALDDFYLVNRAGRWSAAARQAYLLRERLVQPLFDERVVLAARAVPLADRVSGALSQAVLAELCPAIADVPLAGKAPAGKAQAQAARASFDWRRQYGAGIAGFLRDYALDHGTSGGLFEVVSRPAAEKLLAPPQPDRAAVWALATLACLVSGDYRNAREPAPLLSVG